MVVEQESFESDELSDMFRMAELAVRYKEGLLSEDERAILQRWLDASDVHRAWFISALEEQDMQPRLESMKKIISGREVVFQRVCEQVGIKPLVESESREVTGRRVYYIWSGIAASLLLCIASLVLVKYFNRNREFKPAETALTHDVAPGGYHALLTLSNGAQVVLDSIKKGETIARQGSTVVENTKAGELAYNATAGQSAETFYNTLTTRRGDTYKVLLPDGSAVWLNSSSSLHFPTRFTGQTREVTLDGEGYFEIVDNPKQPFIVHTTKEDVHVLGTHFDVSAYSDDEYTVTSLLGGSIKITAGQDQRLLKTPAQVLLEQNAGLKLVDQPNLEAAVAWKNNVFYFESIPLSSVMRQLSRWYSIDYEFQQGFSADNRFSAYITKSTPLSAVLNLLSDTRGVSFEIQGTKVIVKNYSQKKDTK